MHLVNVAMRVVGMGVDETLELICQTIGSGKAND